MIQKAKQFYNQPDIVNGNNSPHAVNQSMNVEQRRFSQCSAASSVSSSNGSNNELSSLPACLNHISYHNDTIDLDEANDSILENSITNSVQLNNDEANGRSPKRSNASTSISKTIKSPQPSPKHRTNGQLSKANSSSTTSLLLSPIRTPNGKPNQQTSLIKKSIKQAESDARLRTCSTSRIPQFNSTAKQVITSTVKKSTNSGRTIKQPAISKLPASPNRRRSLATSTSTSLINHNSSIPNTSFNTSMNHGSISTATRPQTLIRTRTNLNSSINYNKRGLTTNKLLSQSSSSIYSQLSNYNHQLDKLRHTNESPKRMPTVHKQQTTTTKNSKSNVPLSQSTSSGLTTATNHELLNQLTEQDRLDSSTTAQCTKPHSKLNDSTMNQLNQINKTTTNGYAHLWTERQQKLKHLKTADLVVYRDNVKSIKGMNEWHSRDNVANFIEACRKLLMIRDCLLFETDDLVMRKNERSFVLCMLEIARIGCAFGLASPLIIQLEQEIDRELALEEQRQNGTDCTSDYQTATTTNSMQTKDTDSAISSDCELEEHSNEPPTQIVTNDLKSLHDKVLKLKI